MSKLRTLVAALLLGALAAAIPAASQAAPKAGGWNSGPQLAHYQWEG